MRDDMTSQIFSVYSQRFWAIEEKSTEVSTVEDEN